MNPASIPETIGRLRNSPLLPHAIRYYEEIRAEGYARATAKWHLQLFARLDSWLARTRRKLPDLNEGIAERFVKSELSGYPHPSGAYKALFRLLRLLRNAGIVPLARPTPLTPAQQLLESYRHFFLEERGCSSVTYAVFAWHIGRFLDTNFGRGLADVQQLKANDVAGFVQRTADARGRQSGRQAAVALRSFLGYLNRAGLTEANLARAVPVIRCWRLASLPQPLPADAVRRVLCACDRTNAVGRRDYAIMLLLARLGLRSGEIIALRLEDIDWENGMITLHTRKSRRWSRLPLPADAGRAIARYLHGDRPRCACRNVFVRAVAPLGPLGTSSAVSTLASELIKKAGIVTPRTGSHIFRHTLATEMLRRGASLGEIGELLRHRDPDTTAIYAKVDLKALRRLAMRWPGGAL
jgi:integrase